MDYFHELYSSLRKTRILRQWSLLSPLPGNFCPSEAWSKRKSKPSLETTYHWSVRHANNIKGLMIYRNIHTSPDNFLSPQESMDHFSLGKPNQNKNKTSHTFQFCSQNISKWCFLGRKKKNQEACILQYVNHKTLNFGFLSSLNVLQVILVVVTIIRLFK